MGGHYNRGRPRMSLGPGVPDPPATWTLAHHQEARPRIGERLVVHVRSVLGGMHHEYSLASASA
jgi:putative transposase